MCDVTFVTGRKGEEDKSEAFVEKNQGRRTL